MYTDPILILSKCGSNASVDDDVGTECGEWYQLSGGLFFDRYRHRARDAECVLYYCERLVGCNSCVEVAYMQQAGLFPSVVVNSLRLRGSGVYVLVCLYVVPAVAPDSVLDEG